MSKTALMFVPFSVGIIGNPPSVSNCRNLEVTSPQPGMVVTFTEPTAKDGCGPIPLLTSASERSGNFFPVGQHVLTFRFQDSCANEAVCSFFLTGKNYINKHVLIIV